MIWKEYCKKHLWPNLGIILALAWGNWGKKTIIPTQDTRWLDINWKQPPPSYRNSNKIGVSVIVFLCLFSLSARCIQIVSLALIYSTPISLCQSVYWTVYAVDEWGIGVRLPTGAVVVRRQLKYDGTRWHTGGEVKGKLANGMGSQYSSHYFGTRCIQHYYRWCSHLGCQ